jgi:hypothetical protein
MSYLDNTSIQFFLDEEPVYLYMLGYVMLNRIICNANGRLVVTPQI